jgi:hypothetical protein
MTDDNRPPLEEQPEVADAIEDDVAVDAFITGGGSDPDNPEFLQPGEAPAERPDEDLDVRTGAEQEWEPADLAVAEGRDPTPENVERARQELERDGAAAIERTVP